MLSLPQLHEGFRDLYNFHAFTCVNHATLLEVESMVTFYTVHCSVAISTVYLRYLKIYARIYRIYYDFNKALEFDDDTCVKLEAMLKKI